jgi:hypothetical protein
MGYAVTQSSEGPTSERRAERGEAAPSASAYPTQASGSLPTEVRRGSRSVEDTRAQLARVEEDDRKTAEYVLRVALTGSSAAILASVTFLKDIAPQPVPGSWWYLAAAWTVLLLSAGFAFMALFAGRSAAKHYRRALRAELDGASHEDVDRLLEHAYGPNALTRWAMWYASASFIAGVGLLATFAFANLPRASSAATSTAPSDSTDVNKPASPAQFEVFLDSTCLSRACVVVGPKFYDYDLPPRKSPPTQRKPASP